MLDLDEGSALIVAGLVLDVLLLLDGLLGGSLGLLGRCLVGIITRGSRLGGLLALGRGRLVGGGLGRTSLSHDLLLDSSEGDGSGGRILVTSHLGKLLPVHLGCENFSHDLVVDTSSPLYLARQWD